MTEDERGSATRERLLDAAERLFARTGIEGTSLRSVMREAGVNPAAVHYHFGSKEELLRAVLDRVVRPLNEMRLELLDAALATAGGRPLEVERILEAFVRPDVVTIENLRHRGVELAHFVGRVYAQPTPFVQKLMAEQFAGCAQRFLPELHRSLPHLDLDEIAWRMRCVVGVLVGLFAQAPPRGEAGPFDTSEPDKALARIVGFVAPGMRAPAPTTARRARVRSRSA
jgi:AcrR family transcriptional regulator